MVASNSLNLAQEFPAVSKQTWQEKATVDLKGKPLEKLTTKLYEGTSIVPLYLAEDAPAESLSGLPGMAPLTRDGDALGRVANGWDIRQCLRHPSVQTTNQQALEDLNGGCSSLTLRLHDEARKAAVDPSATAEGDGIMVQRLPELSAALAGIRLDWIRLSLDAGAAAIPAAAALIALYQEQNLDLQTVQAELHIDPLAVLASSGAFPVAMEQALSDAATVAQWCQENAPNIQALSASALAVHEAGGTAVQEIATVLAAGVSYLRACDEVGMSPQQSMEQIVLEVAVGCDQFTEIAKLRALRTLWSRVLTACGVGPDQQKLTIHAVMGERSMSAVDPWVNMLRGTVAGFAAAVGGAASITISPFDQRHGQSDTLARRIARNTQIILNEESHLARVVDPGGGSYYLESLTHDFADRAWEAFQKIEENGGLLAALTSASLAAEIAAVVVQREANLSKRKDPLTGVSEFANVSEVKLSRPSPDLSSLLREAQAARVALADDAAVTDALGNCASASGPQRWLATIAAAAAGASFGSIASILNDGAGSTAIALPAMHLAEGFEALRRASAAQQKATGKLPQVFLATLGPVAKHTLRAGFARNFFGAGGIEAVDTSPATGYADEAALIEAFRASGTKLACICGTDPDYAERAEATLAALTAAGATTLVVAGKPPAELEASWQAAGMNHAIFMGCPVIPLLRDVLQAQGVQL